MSESIYNLIPREYVVPTKSPMYKSVHHPVQELTGSTFGCKGTTRLPGAGVVSVAEGKLFGPHKTLPARKLQTTQVNNRAEYESLKKESETRKAAVPKRDDKPVIGIKSNKNFITANAVETILMVPKVTEKPVLNYLEKEDYGKTPEYLTHVKEEIRRENEMIEKYVKEQMGVPNKEVVHYDEFPEDERAELIIALKRKWDAVNAKYQKITHLVQLDTTGQIRRKEQMEAELKQIESDIEKLSRHGPVLLS